MKAASVTEEKMKGANTLLIFSLTYLLGLFAALFLTSVVIHQNHIYSILINETGFAEKGSAIDNYITDFMTNYGTNFRTFKHGALHGTLTGVFLVLPIIAVNALFERKGGKYIFINAGFWTISLALMGAIICAFS